MIAAGTTREDMAQILPQTLYRKGALLEAQLGVCRPDTTLLYRGAS
jgi:hypothetical protein